MRRPAIDADNGVIIMGTPLAGRVLPRARLDRVRIEKGQALNGAWYATPLLSAIMEEEAPLLGVLQGPVSFVSRLKRGDL
jgi:hypothetical protein